MDKQKVEISFFFVLLAAVSVLTFFVFQPLLKILILAAVCAVLFQPLYRKILSLMGKSKNVAAIATVALFLVFLITPIFFVGVQIFHQTQGLFALVSSDKAEYSHVIEHAVETPIRAFLPDFSFNLNEYAVGVLGFISDNINGLISQTLIIFFQTFLLLLAFFFFLRDGEKMLADVIALSPFESRHNAEIIGMTHKTIVSVIKETVVVSIIRWVLVGVGFYTFGIPNAAFWGIVAGIVGAIPGLGTPFVIIPAAIFLFLQGSTLSAVGLLVLGALIMGFVDNLLATYILGKGFDVPPLFALFSILGGVVFFGPLGLIFGPIVLSLFIATIHIYKILCLRGR